MAESRFSSLVTYMRELLAASGLSRSELSAIADEAAVIADGVYQPIDQIIADGRGQNLQETTDLILIGLIVAKHGLVAPKDFGK